jgi:di/tricarboxylate transporter
LSVYSRPFVADLFSVMPKLKLSTKLLIKKRFASLSIFVMLGLLLAYDQPSVEIAWMTGILLLTIYLFAFEIVEVDVAAVSIMVLLGLSSLLAPLMGLQSGLVDTAHLFDGFSSNAVMSIIAVMIIGAGLDRTGLMSKVATLILQLGGSSEKRIIPIVSSTVGFISSFMQNVGATALFIPVVSRISARSGLSMSRLLMPMGFCAILGGTVTMVGSSPLILLNDLIATSNSHLSSDDQMEMWSLFSTTPIGLALLLSGILYFVVMGRFVLPSVSLSAQTSATSSLRYFHDVYGVDFEVKEIVVKEGSPLIGKHLDDCETAYKVRIIANKRSGQGVNIGAGALARDTEITAGMVIGVVADPKDLNNFVDKYQLEMRSELRSFSEALSPSKSGIAEVVIPPGSQLLGQSARDVWMRKTYGIAMIGLHRDGETYREGGDIRSIKLHAGDTIVVHTAWEALARLEKDRNFVVVTTEFPHEDLRPNKVGWALAFFLLALGLVLFTEVRLSIALLTGAVGMVLSGVLRMDEAYDAVSWKTVFLLASLIPLGLAVEETGTAKWIADQALSLTGEAPVWVMQLIVALLATFFTLVMSNVGATVLLVPLAVNIAIGIGADPAMFALIVALATSNSFIIPTHQVNSLIMGPGGYKVTDFIKAGTLMTVIFLAVMLTVLNWLY